MRATLPSTRCSAPHDILHFSCTAHVLPMSCPCPARILPMPCPRRIDCGHVLMSDGSCACLSKPLTPFPTFPPRSLQDNRLLDDAKQALQAAAGSSVKLEF